MLSSSASESARTISIERPRLSGRTAAATFMLGASAVQSGTAFLRCEEANVRDAHRAALAEATDSCTIVTDMISGRPARYIRNRLADELVGSGLKPLSIGPIEPNDAAG